MLDNPLVKLLNFSWTFWASCELHWQQFSWTIWFLVYVLCNVKWLSKPGIRKGDLLTSFTLRWKCNSLVTTRREKFMAFHIFSQCIYFLISLIFGHLGSSYHVSSNLCMECIFNLSTFYLQYDLLSGNAPVLRFICLHLRVYRYSLSLFLLN